MEASPILFCVYMNELLERLEKQGVGCWIGDKFLGALSYADDLTLICPSASGIQQMARVRNMGSNLE